MRSKDQEIDAGLFGHPDDALERVAGGDMAFAINSVTFAYRARKLVKQGCGLSPLDVDETLGLVIIDHVRELELGCVLTG
jgi:hypothetical protein